MTKATLWLLVVLPLLLLVYDGSHGFPSSDSDSRNHEEALVRAALSDFEFAVRSRDVAMIRAHYCPPVAQSVANTTSPASSIFLFIRQTKDVPDAPLVYIANPVITWQGETAIVSCWTIWCFRTRDNKLVRWTLPEQYRLIRRGDRYVIAASAGTDEVFASIDGNVDLRQVRRHIERKLARGGE